SAGNSVEDSTRIRLDGTPPTGTLANSPDTSEAVTFLVTWNGSGTDGSGSGISGTYDIRYQVNGGAWQDWKTNFTGISDMFTSGQQDSVYGFEAVSYDRLGNREAFTGTAETITVVDTGFRDDVPPSIQHTPEVMVDEGSTVSIQAQIVDNVDIMQATLFYRNSGEIIFQSKLMVDQGGDLFEVDIAPEEVPLSGLNYYISAFDGSNFSFHPSINWDTVPNNVSVRILGNESQGLARSEPLPGGDQSSFFRMISVPLNLEDADPLAVLRDDLGSYNPKKWRLFQYKPSTESYAEYPDIDPFAPGKAFWLIVREPNKVVDSGVGTTVATNQPFTITLQQGWNDIALPFNFPVDWSDIEVVQGSVDDIMGPYTYQEEWLLPSQLSTLFPWEGYAVFSQTDGVQLQVQPVANLSQSTQKIASAADWEIGIEAFCGAAHDRPNFIGVAEDANENWDSRDYLEPLHLGEFVSLSFPHDDWSSFHGRFTTDFRSRFEDGQVWRFEVQTNISNEPVTLTFRNMSALPPGLQAILLDKETLQQVQLRSDAVYEFEMIGTDLKREFDLVIGTEEYIRNSEELQQGMPNSFFLSQNFPNPFNAGTSLSYHLPEPSHVTIQVLNILGQEVRELLSEKRSPGTYQIHWDGKSNDGKDISTGIYLVRFEAGKFRQIRKITLIR
ncbi:T9SS type A sorting domain-containing protein, partial [bacterium]|nr:T9SS type A sorting domain-containing protein [bacterium]